MGRSIEEQTFRFNQRKTNDTGRFNQGDAGFMGIN